MIKENSQIRELFTSMNRLGLGCIGIGRPWGSRSDIPSSQEVETFLLQSVSLGINYFDTAPSYGESETRVGNMLATLPEIIRNGITVATKIGEHWDTKTNTPFTDHSYLLMKESIDQSLARLGYVSVLQVHKSTVDILKSSDIAKTIEYAKKQGIQFFGASVKDPETLVYACSCPWVTVIQVPAGIEEFGKLVQIAMQKRKFVVINRPFNTGKAIITTHSDKVRAFTSILQSKFNGVVLTGTTSIVHLQENLSAFDEAILR